MSSWKTGVGLNNVGSYQVSGKPYATGSVLVPVSGTALRVEFPEVTKWFQVMPHEGTSPPVRVSFSEHGMQDGNYFHVLASTPSGSTPPSYDLKVSEIWLMSVTSDATTVDVLAGLTNIQPRSAATTSGVSWSGSSGVG